MRLDNQHVSDDCDEHCADCGDNSDHQPSIFSDDHASLARRNYAKLLASVGRLIIVASFAAPLTGLTRVFKRSYTGPIYSDGAYLVDGDGEHISESALSEGEKVTVFPESRPSIEKAPMLLVRHAKDVYGDATNFEYTVSDYAAYSKVCIHAGCMVSNEDEATLICSCHFSRSDLTASAKVVNGPPSRALPQLPIMLSNEDNLITVDDFSGLVGPGGE